MLDLQCKYNRNSKKRCRKIKEDYLENKTQRCLEISSIDKLYKILYQIENLHKIY